MFCTVRTLLLVDTEAQAENKVCHRSAKNPYVVVCMYVKEFHFFNNVAKLPICSIFSFVFVYLKFLFRCASIS